MCGPTLQSMESVLCGGDTNAGQPKDWESNQSYAWNQLCLFKLVTPEFQLWLQKMGT